MNDLEISVFPYSSGDIYKVSAKVDVEVYHEKEDGTEEVFFTLEDIEVERRDGSIVDLTEEELEATLSKADFNKIEARVLDECRYSV